MRTEAPEKPLPSEEGPPAGPPKGSGPFAGLRQRLIPRSVLGVVVLLLAAAIGAGFSGTVLYAYYQYRLQKAEDRIEKFIDRFDNRYDSALKGSPRSGTRPASRCRRSWSHCGSCGLRGRRSGS
jgi:hypothetical protein